ncbi:MAG: hypothetical protein EB084_05155 [Proteobacteria bacterium]|nr:hypothetical protein [Pseudomonadota bacterium]
MNASLALPSRLQRTPMPAAAIPPAAASDATHDAAATTAAPVAVQIDTLDAPQVWKEGFTGKGIGIAILDTGAGPHPDFRSRLVAFKDFVHAGSTPPDDADPAHAYDDEGHGTAVATVAAGDGTAGQAIGSAPGANVISLKAVGSDGMAWAANVVKAIDWAVENKARYNIRVLNMSFFLDDPNVAAHQPVLQALERAADAGIIPVAAASNDGPRPRSLHTIASYPHVVTVAAFDARGTRKRDDDRIASFSSRGPGDHGELKPDVATPGANVVVGTVRGGYTRSNGTSFASPIAAGVIATWLEANPSLNVTQVQQIVAETSHPLSSYDHFAQGYGEMDALAGLHKAISMREPQPTA